jgi:hypothetical protein
MNQLPEVRLQALIQTFCLAVSLQMIRRAHVHSSISQLEQILPEIADENFISVRYDYLGHAVVAVNMIDEQLRHGGGSKRVFQWYEMSKFCQFIHDHQNCVILP